MVPSCRYLYDINRISDDISRPVLSFRQTQLRENLFFSIALRNGRTAGSPHNMSDEDLRTVTLVPSIPTPPGDFH